MNEIQQAVEQGRTLGFLTDEDSAEWFEMTVLQLIDKARV